MERAALIGGIILAIIVAIGAMLPHGSFIHIDGDWMDDDGPARRAAFVQPTPGNLAAETFPVTTVRIRYAAANVEVIPEERTDVSVEIENPGRAPMPEVRRDGDRVIVDGRLARRIDRCDDDSVELDGYGRVERSALPRIRVRTPLDVDLSLHGAVHGEIAAGRSLDLSVSQCADARVGDMAGDVGIDVSGSGNVQGGAAGATDIDVSGSGSVRMGATRGTLNIDVAGSGAAQVDSFEGETVEIDVAGSGNVGIGTLQSQTISVDVAGSGEVRVRGGAASEADVSIAGSGDVDLAAAIAGLEANIAGSGDIIVRHALERLDATLVGSGDVVVPSQPPQLSKSVIGSGDVTVRAAIAAPASPPPPAAPALPAPPSP